jgi:putative endonuclease
MFRVKTSYTCSMKRRQLGNLGEDIACRFLESKGYVITARNYLKPWGEIDVIGIKNGTVRFIEIKTVSRENTGGLSREMDHQPEDLIDQRKLAKVARTASLYMDEMKDSREYQIDTVGVILDHKTKTAQCRLLEQVLEGDV